MVCWLGLLAICFAPLPACVHPLTEPQSRGVGEAERATLGAEFTLLSWNTHKRGRPGFDAELTEFAAGVELLVLQEVTEADGPWSTLADRRAWTLVVAFEYGRENYGTGVATASVASPIREQALLSPIVEPLTHTPKSSLLIWVALDGSDDTLLLVNLHAINFRPAPALAAQLELLDGPIDGHSGPVVVAGDFNRWSAARREVVASFADRHGLVSAFAERRGFDDIYVRGLEVREAERLRSRSSDHDALRVVFGVPADPI